jgi:hypothetical protein
MKNVIILILILFINLNAQDFTVEKISGDVFVMSGTEEEWTKVKIGQKLNKNDLISTSEKSLIRLSSKEGKFLLQSNSALNLSSVKKITLNELLLALAAEEIRNIPSKKNNSDLNNTAVYGKEETLSKKEITLSSKLGSKKINGAKQLAESGYKESALLVAKETYRKYPETKTNLENRLYFVDLMLELKLKNEAVADLTEMKNSSSSGSSIKGVEERITLIRDENIKSR